MKKTLALIAHDHRKRDLLAWAKKHRALLAQHNIIATGTTGGLLEQYLTIPVSRCLSGPLGGDQQIGARIAEGTIDALIFFWDPLEAQPHDPDIKALLRLAVVWNLPLACNASTADLLIESQLLSATYHVAVADHTQYTQRRLPTNN